VTSVGELAALARADGFPRSGRGPFAVSWAGRLADHCSGVLEQEMAASRRRAAVLWAEHGIALREAGKEPWFQRAPAPDVERGEREAAPRRLRSVDRGANGRVRECAGCSGSLPPSRRRGRPRTRCPDCGGRPWTELELAS